MTTPCSSDKARAEHYSKQGPGAPGAKAAGAGKAIPVLTAGVMEEVGAGQGC